MKDDELGEWIADFENRISYLENIHTPSHASLNNPVKEEFEPIETPLPPPYQKLVDVVEQTRRMGIGTRDMITEHLKEKPLPSPPSYLYKSIKEDVADEEAQA